ncbi:DUF3265 domain-containing protein [Vibrio parahaemolyticus]|nr:DUF3265 domain-containing protein [Vibrio parahaemolyticus]
MTRRLRGIHAAWYFGFAVSFGGKSGLRKVGLGGIHPLTQRYTNYSAQQSTTWKKLSSNIGVIF